MTIIEQNKLNMHRSFAEAWSQGNPDAVDELCTPDHVYYDPSGPVRGTEAVKHFIAQYRTAFPDLHFTLEDVIAEGDKVVARWTAVGTHQGDFFGISATGKQGTVTGITIARVAVDGKFAESWTNLDSLGMLQYIGGFTLPRG
jgi:steroid delta-isomerase-like uncharacterized protein